MELSKEQIKDLTTDEVYQLFGGKEKRGATSEAIRHLTQIGFTRSEIAKMLDLIYQHVRNVQLQILKKKI